jgi:hypothetical protein
VLNEYWDPLDVVDLEVDDEYDCYVSAICLMLADQQVSESAIDRHLYAIGTVHMGLSPQSELRGRVQNNCCYSGRAKDSVRKALTLSDVLDFTLGRRSLARHG